MVLYVLLAPPSDHGKRIGVDMNVWIVMEKQQLLVVQFFIKLLSHYSFGFGLYGGWWHKRME